VITNLAGSRAFSAAGGAVAVVGPVVVVVVGPGEAVVVTVWVAGGAVPVATGTCGAGGLVDGPPGLFPPPQPLITKKSRKKPALRGLKKHRNAVDICRKDKERKWDRTADIHG
jgi:hypothetical protein